ncbi:hypothetical protein [Halotalea alkalilenta]|uniref:hypothetical protein n=1 Tax=Halotalea alkalilenta TaxID=376489 RepID=UPI0012371D4E|nr:hypothetical protein [Halotalea alkalilenta]
MVLMALSAFDKSCQSIHPKPHLTSIEITMPICDKTSRRGLAITQDAQNIHNMTIFPGYRKPASNTSGSQLDQLDPTGTQTAGKVFEDAMMASSRL